MRYQEPDIICPAMGVPEIGESYRGAEGHSGYLLRQAWHAFRTAKALLDAPRFRAAPPLDADADRFRVTFGDVSLIAPPGTLDGAPLRWAHGPRPLGGDPPAWD